MVDFEMFHAYADYLGASSILTPEQRSAVQTSLVLTKREMHLQRLKFWGRVRGVQTDYYIAQGVADGDWYNRKTLYSRDCVTWALLNPATEAMRANAWRGNNLRFTGDMSFEADLRPLEASEKMESDKANEPAGGGDAEETTTAAAPAAGDGGGVPGCEGGDAPGKMKEEDRLVAIIAEIDSATSVIPRGAFTQAPNGVIAENRAFPGLTTSEASRLNNYLHLRPPTSLFKKTLLQKADLNPAVDFLDPIMDDIVGAPSLAWSLQYERGGAYVTLRSLLWPGYTFFHLPGTAHYGSVYDGEATYNIDLPFMF